MLPVIERNQRVTLQFLAATVHYLAGFQLHNIQMQHLVED